MKSISSSKLIDYIYYIGGASIHMQSLTFAKQEGSFLYVAYRNRLKDAVSYKVSAVRLAQLKVKKRLSNVGDGGTEEETKSM